MGVLHFMLQHLKKNRAAKNKRGKAAPLYACFVEFDKTFDKVNRDVIWMRLEERGLHGTFLGAIKAMYNTVIQKVKVGGKLGEEFETHSGVKQGDPLSTDLFGIMIEILYELLRACCPTVGIEIGKKRVPCSFFIDDLKLMAESVGELQAALDVLSAFCDIFDFTVNMDKTELAIFRHRNRQVAEVPLRYRDMVIRVVEDKVKYLGLFYGIMADSSPSIEERELVAGRASFGCLSNISKIGNMSIETKIRMGNIMVRPVASFGCQIWGANFLELNKALHCCLESVHTRFLRMVLGVGSKVDQDVLRVEACSPAYHSHWVTCVFNFWNELSTSEGMMAHDALYLYVVVYVVSLYVCCSQSL